MKKNLNTILIGCAILFLIATQSFYVVMQPEQAIVLQFGNPVRLIQTPGLKFKVPFIQNVVFYDKRLLNLEPPAQEVVLKDKKRLDVDTFSRYKITEPLTFYKTVRTEYQAQNRLKEIVNSSARNVLATVTLLELLSEKRTEIMKRISEAVKADAAQIGVEVADVRIRRADLPIQVSQAINDRMKTERIREAKGYRADGEKRAQEIRATADKQATITVANAEKEAQKIKGEGDKKATEIWNNATSVDPEFYAFYRTLEAYRNSFDEQTSVVLAPEGEFFNYKNAIPSENSTKARVNVKNLINSVDRASLLITSKIKSPIRCVFEDNTIKISSTTSLGAANDKVSASIDGKRVEIGFNNAYLTDCLKTVDVDEVNIELNGPISPIIIRPLEGDSFIFLIIPMRLKNENIG